MKKVLEIFLLLALLSCGYLNAMAQEVTIIGENNDSSNFYGGATELKPESKIKVDGNYTISLNENGAKCFSRDDDLSGNWIGYLTSKEDGSSSVSVFRPVGTHTVLRVHINLINRSKQETNWLKRVKCDVVYDDRYVFETMPVQYNPDQKDDNDYVGYASIEARPAEPLVSMHIGFFVSVPYIVRDSDKPLYAYITVDDDVYTVNLRDLMVIG